MAPIKFEENIKDKLEKRSLSPSSESWSKLSDRLDAEDKKSRKPVFWWLSIAAGFIIMMAISIQYFGTEESEGVMPQVVEDKVLEEQLKGDEPKLNETKSIDLVSEDIQQEDKMEESSVIEEQKIRDSKKTTHKKTKPEIELAEQKDTNPIKSKGEQEDLLIKETDLLLNEAIMQNALADAMKTLKSENSSVTDKEIDSLFKMASKELLIKQFQKENSKMVDANALLMSVEDEMGQSFRSRVFEALKESYETIRTAVADRNN